MGIMGQSMQTALPKAALSKDALEPYNAIHQSSSKHVLAATKEAPHQSSTDPMGPVDSVQKLITTMEQLNTLPDGSLSSHNMHNMSLQRLKSLHHTVNLTTSENWFSLDRLRDVQHSTCIVKEASYPTVWSVALVSNIFAAVVISRMFPSSSSQWLLDDIHQCTYVCKNNFRKPHVISIVTWYRHLQQAETNEEKEQIQAGRILHDTSGSAIAHASEPPSVCHIAVLHGLARQAWEDNTSTWSVGH
ncbi:hypothetical protein BDR05DRAFT_943702 [Suillus weaverae]|nr:hypothetical protein BDR05DRAFT_943702 [Suillus weaverae]